MKTNISPIFRAAHKLRVVAYRLLHGVNPTCPRCMNEFTRQARIENFVGSQYPSGRVFRRVFRCDHCKCEFPSALMTFPLRPEAKA